MIFTFTYSITEASLDVQLTTGLGLSRSCLDCSQSLFFCKLIEIECFALQAVTLDEDQIYLGGGEPL